MTASRSTGFGWNPASSHPDVIAVAPQGDVPRGMTVAATKEWVGSDHARAQAALLHEESLSDARSTLIAWLEEVVING